MGRERELADLRTLLATSRLVTLVGAGAAGKTRLALQVAADALDEYPDGAWLVDLAQISDPDLVVAEIGRTLGVQVQPGRSPFDQIADYLRGKELPLLLDDCEQVIETAADTADRLLRSCPVLHLLASSRERLGVDGEVVFAVPSLALPEAADRLDVKGSADNAEVELAARSEAVRLFIARATATLPSFTLDRTNVRAVVEICRRLDGIPSPSSWRPPGSTSSPPARSPRASMTGSVCSRADAARRCHGNGRCRGSSIGAGTCSTRSTGASSAGSRCLPVAGRSTQPRRSPMAGTILPSRPRERHVWRLSMASDGSLIARWSWSRATPPPVMGCWRRSANTPGTASRRAVRRPSNRPVTWRTSGGWRSMPSRDSRART